MRVAVAVVSRGVASEVIHGGTTTVHRWHHKPNDVAQYAFEVAGSMMRIRDDTLDYMAQKEVEIELRKQELAEREEQDKKAQEEAENGTPIKDLDLTVRSQNILRAESIYTIEQLCERRASDLIRAPGMGRKSLNEITEILQLRGLYLKGEQA